MTPHEVLGVAANAPRAELHAARRRLLFLLHPDRQPPERAAVAAAAVRRVEEAYAALLAAHLAEPATAAAVAPAVSEPNFFDGLLAALGSVVVDKVQAEAARQVAAVAGTTVEDLLVAALRLARGP